jgi:hypothetical protein
MSLLGLVLFISHTLKLNACERRRGIWTKRRKQGRDGRRTHLLPDQDLILILITLSNLVLYSLGLVALDFLADFLEVYHQQLSPTRHDLLRWRGKHTVKDLGTLSSFSSDCSELFISYYSERGTYDNVTHCSLCVD